VVGLILVAAAAAAVLLTRGRDQAQVSADALPMVATTHEADIYVDCSKINGVAYFPDNPCETFVLLESQHFGSAEEFWTAETRQLRVSGWHHSSPQLVDYDGQAAGMASPSESWVAPTQRACAYVTTVQKGVAAEKREIFPRDPNDIPHGVYDLYQRASAARPNQTFGCDFAPRTPAEDASGEARRRVRLPEVDHCGRPNSDGPAAVRPRGRGRTRPFPWHPDSRWKT
jgi:hypothetical protein